MLYDIETSGRSEKLGPVGEKLEVTPMILYPPEV